MIKRTRMIKYDDSDRIFPYTSSRHRRVGTPVAVPSSVHWAQEVIGWEFPIGGAAAYTGAMMLNVK